MCSFAVSETSGSETVMLLVWVAVDASTETLSRAAAAFGSRMFVFAVIAPAVREAYPNLPLVVGEGAGKNAANLFETLKPFDSVTKQMVAALRVGDRRWTLKLSSGVDVMLPDDGVVDALKTLINLDRDRSLLQREIAAVDLRLADRVSVRIHDKAELTMPDSGSALPDVPTSSTKRNT